MALTEISKQHERMILKKIKASSKKSISAKDFNKIVLSNAKGKSKEKKKIDYGFSFDVKKIDNGFLFTLYGKHQSTNVINSFPFREKLRYKTSIKEAAKLFFLQNREFKKVKAMKRATLKPIAYNKVSRDDDGCSTTLKIIRDIIITYGYIKDDSRKYIMQLKTDEVLTKDYKVEVYLSENNE